MSASTSGVARVLERAQPGSCRAVRDHIRRGEILVKLIAGRWPAVTRPEQWRAKHVRWALERGLSDHAPGTRYHYYRTVRAIAAAMNRWRNWSPYLNGPWCHPQGKPNVGHRQVERRPPKLARGQRSSHG